MKSNAITFTIVTLLLIGGAYWYFVSGTGNQQPLTTVSLYDSQQTSQQKQFQVMVSKLRPISFNISIFSSQNFLALINLATPIAPEPLGRLDPFASIYVNTSSKASGQ